jgi:hypothetical protein
MPVDDEALQTSIRKFLKLVGVSSQREIERALAEALRAQSIEGTEAFPVTMTLEVPALKLKETFQGELKLR